jgi:hypothetical protein
MTQSNSQNLPKIQFYCVFTIEQGACNWLRFTLQTEKSAKSAALKILQKAKKDKLFTGKEEYDWRKKSRKPTIS